MKLTLWNSIAASFVAAAVIIGGTQVMLSSFGEQVCERLDFSRYPKNIHMELEYKCPQVVRIELKRGRRLVFSALWFLLFLGFLNKID